ncbi:MAG: S8 family serine peptidase [Bacteroidota bacterium]
MASTSLRTAPARALLTALLTGLFLVAGFAPTTARADDGTRRADTPTVQPGVVAVKFAEGQAVAKGATRTGLATFDKVSTRYRVQAIDPAFPQATRLAGKRSSSDLQRIVYVRYAAEVPPAQVAAELARDPAVEYAEPVPVFRLQSLGEIDVDATLAAFRAMDVTPNDPQVPTMTHLNQVSLPAAWEVVRGEQGTVVIAIADGGTDWRHPDLEANVWTNAAEVPGNGVDDDENGFTDDVNGWNFANNSNDPTGLSNTPQNADHGTVVAGVAAAVSDNGLGVTGSSWNAQFIPINVGCPDQDNGVCFGYDGILYAALVGADIVNTSWGGPGTAQVLQDVIDAAYEQGTLVVTSAGNGPPPTGIGTNNDVLPQNPANLRRVLSVGATNKSDDQKAPYSNFGRSVDVFAPGSQTNSTLPNGQYTTAFQGTSFSAPLVAGIVALVKTVNPGFTVDQLREQVRVTTDPIDDANLAFRGRLGIGRVNALRAVTETGQPAIRLLGMTYADGNGDGEIVNGEVIEATARLTNYLATASNATFTLATNDANVELLVPTVTLPQVGAGDTVNVTFQFQLNETTPADYEVPFFIEIEGTGTNNTGLYTDVDDFRVRVNPLGVITHNTGTIRASLTTVGNIGWSGFPSDFDPNSVGEGFQFNGQNYLFEGGFLLGASVGRVSDGLRGGGNDAQDRDFAPVPGASLRFSESQTFAAEQATVELNDEPAPNTIGARILQETFADTSAARQDYIIFRYTITNDRDADLANLHAGLFLDWDINSDASDYVRFDAQRRMAIAQNAATGPNLLFGTTVLSTTAGLTHRAVDNPNEIYGGDAGNGFTSQEKWNFLSNGLQTEALDATDVSTMIGTGPFAVKAGCPFEIAFAIIAGETRAELNASSDNAQAFFDDQLRGVGPNASPSFVTAAGLELVVAENEALAFTFEAADADVCDALVFTLGDDAPLGARIDAQTGVLRFTPGFDQEGRYPITVRVTDGRETATLTATIVVSNVNRAPVFASTPADTVITSAQQLTLSFASEDPDNDALTYRLLQTVDNAALDAATGTLTFTPTATQTGTFRFEVEATDGEFTIMEEVTVTVIAPDFAANPSFPNPGTPPLTITYQLPAQGTVTLRVYDLLGREVRTLIDGTIPPGPGQAIWNGRDNAGTPVASGVYFYRLIADTPDQTFEELHTMILVR